MADGTTVEGVKEQETEVERERTQELNDLRTVVMSPAGRRYIKKMLGDCYMYRTTYDKSNSKFAQNEGMRIQGLKIFEDLASLVDRRMMSVEELVPFVLNLPDEEER